MNVVATLFRARAAKGQETLRDRFATDLIEQKIREADQSLRAAKATLASLIVRERQERRTRDGLAARIDDLEGRARSAMKTEDMDLAEQAAEAIAEMENEKAVQTDALGRLETRIMRLRHSVERTHRRIIELKQGALSARAIEVEQRMQARIDRSLGGTSAIREAEDLVQHVLHRDDQFEEGEVLDSIDADLSHNGIADRLADAGRVTPADVLKRLSKTPKSSKGGIK